jgi:LemA protein
VGVSGHTGFTGADGKGSTAFRWEKPFGFLDFCPFAPHIGSGGKTRQEEAPMTLLIVLGIVAFVVVGSILYFVAVYNGLVVVKNDIQKAWANIDVLLKQRHDELPKLIKTCESYMGYEKGTLTQIVELRNSAQAARSIGDKAQAEGRLTGALQGFFALAENYPQLKADTTFQNLQQRISGLENQIADRREFYNESVNNYNIRIASLPDVFVARMMNLQPQEMFKVSEDDRRDVDINIAVPR